MTPRLEPFTTQNGYERATQLGLCVESLTPDTEQGSFVFQVTARWGKPKFRPIKLFSHAHRIKGRALP